MKQLPSMILLKSLDQNMELQSWSFTSDFEVGRAIPYGLVLRDGSVSRRHAKIFQSEYGWYLRDLGSRNRTFLNGTPFDQDPVLIQSGDLITFGTVNLRVEIHQSSAQAAEPFLSAEAEELIQTIAQPCLENVLNQLTGAHSKNGIADEKMLALLRAGFHLGNHQSEMELIDSILDEALEVLNAQRGALVLANDEGELQLRAEKTASECRPGQVFFSSNLARTCLQEGTSILCPRSNLDRELNGKTSIRAGEMNSLLCVLLRTPRKRLGVLHLDRNPSQPPFDYEDLHLADALAACVSAGLESAQLLGQQQELFLNTLATLAQAVELRDRYTAGHAQRVTRYSLMLGKRMHLSVKDLYWLEIGAPLHDIGKIGVDDVILRKPGPLTKEESRIMQSHTVKGEEMLKNLVTLFPILPIVRSHHERWDGAGYPDQLAGEAIPLLARVVAVADTFDAMTTDRTYRKGRTFSDVAEEFRLGSGTQFDPLCIEAFFGIGAALETELGRRNNERNGTTAVLDLKKTRAKLLNRVVSQAKAAS